MVNINYNSCISNVLAAFSNDFFNNCIPVSQYLGYLIGKNKRGVEIYTARSTNIPKSSIIPMEKHQVTIIKETDTWVSLDAVISAYDKSKGEVFKLSAGSKEELMHKLSIIYLGDWAINQAFDLKICKYLSGKGEQLVVRQGMLPFKVKWDYEGKMFEEGAYVLDKFLGVGQKKSQKINPDLKKLAQKDLERFARLN